MTRGTPYDLDYLRKPKHRIEWEAFCTILENARGLWSLQELSDLNETFMRSPFFSYVGVVARFLFTSRDLFDWICKRSIGGGAQLFSDCVHATFEHLGKDVTVIRLEVVDGYRPSTEFFWMTRGAFIAMPRLVGSGDAEVDMSIDGSLATYHVKYKNKRGTLAAFGRWITWPFAVRSAARELKRTNEELQSQFYELAEARDRLEHQARQLRTAHAINDRIHGDLDLDLTLATVTAALVEEGAFATAQIHLAAREASGSPRVVQTEGTVRAVTIEQQLESLSGVPLGMVVVSLTASEDRDRGERLLAFVAPTIALAIDNALAYYELANYKTHLEQIVDERTLDLRETRDALAGTVEQLREAQSARQRFFANISHEIRTPLSLIVLAAGDVETRAGALLDARARQSLGSITEGARKLLRLVDELLLLAAGQENKLVLRPEPTDLAALISHMFAAWRPAAEGASLTLSLDVPASLIVMVDPVALERVASNLVSNAIKYTPSGGCIDVQLAHEPAGIRLSVLDTGQGIDADLAARLFGRFERAAGNAPETIGTGIGLALVKQLVEAHLGTVEALPRASGGTEMRVMLPADVVTSSAASATRPRLHLEAPAAELVHSGMVVSPPGLSAGTILIAEDDPKLAHQISQLLAATYTVVIALDGEAALGLVVKHQPQLLVTDVDMPKMNGIELAKRFRETTGDSLAPVIILSAVMDLGTRIAGLEAGAVDYIGKPFDPRELEARVRSQFRMRELAVRLQRAEQLSTLGILTSGLAHELRNPANGIVNAIAPILEMLPADVPKGVTALMEVMKDCAEQIGFLSRQLLGFRGAAPLEMQLAHVPELVQRAVSLAQRTLDKVAVRTDLAVDRSVMCAPPLLVQVLTNLIENAAHAAGRGGWIEVRGSRDGDRIVIEVQDSGPGVPLPLRERIFEPFFTTKPPGVGTGLGLSVARAIVQRHGGVLEVRDRGLRAAFVIELPDTPAD